MTANLQSVPAPNLAWRPAATVPAEELQITTDDGTILTTDDGKILTTPYSGLVDPDDPT